MALGAPGEQQLVLADRSAMTAVTSDGIVIGRGDGCDIVLDDAAVSRRHARVALVDEEPIVEDLSSANGVFVNGARIQGPHALAEGDVVVVGPRVFRVRRVDGAQLEETRKRPATIDDLWNEASRPSRQAATTVVGALELADRGAAELLLEGRTEEAAQVLEPQLDALLERAKSARTLPPDALDAARLALTLARQRREERWLDYVIDLYDAGGAVPPRAVVRLMSAAMRALDLARSERLESYLSHMRDQALEEDARQSLAELESLTATDTP